MKASIEFNVSKDTLVEFLESKGFSADEMQRDFKLTEDMYRVAQAEFQQDKAAKAKAQQIDLPKGAGANEPKKKRDEEDLSIKKKEEKVKAKEEIPVEAKEETVPAIEVPKTEPVKEEKAATMAKTGGKAKSIKPL